MVLDPGVEVRASATGTTGRHSRQARLIKPETNNAEAKFSFMTSRAWREANGRVFSDRFAKLRSDRQVNSMQRQFLDRNPVLFVILIQFTRCYFGFRENLETGDPRDIMFRRRTKKRADFDFSRNLAGTAKG